MCVLKEMHIFLGCHVKHHVETIFTSGKMHLYIFNEGLSFLLTWMFVAPSLWLKIHANDLKVSWNDACFNSPDKY